MSLTMVLHVKWTKFGRNVGQSALSEFKYSLDYVVSFRNEGDIQRWMRSKIEIKFLTFTAVKLCQNLMGLQCIIFMGLVIRAQSEWRCVGRASSCNAFTFATFSSFYFCAVSKC